MPPALRRVAWGSFLVVEAGLVAASTAYVGLATREFWLVLGAAVVATIAYAVTVRTTPLPTLGDTASTARRWYWF